MYLDDKYRSFLLGTADEETETGIEEGILDGRINIDHLDQVEEELIDDHLFGRLSTDEERMFRSRFLSNPERARKLEFASALQRYSAQKLPVVERRAFFAKWRELARVPSFWPLVGALSCTLLVALWLGERNLSLNHELAQSTSENNERQRVIESMLEEQSRRAAQSKPRRDSIESQPAAISNSERVDAQPVFHLSPGVSRGLATVKVLHVNPQATAVSIVLELPFNPVNTLREELLNSQDKTIWSQQFSSAKGIANNGSTTIVLPARLLLTGEYRLRLEAGAGGEESGSIATYLFRVRTD